MNGERYTAMARPTGCYVGYAVTLMVAGAMVTGQHIDPAAILTLLGPVWAQVGWYSQKRTEEKLADADGSVPAPAVPGGEKDLQAAT